MHELWSYAGQETPFDNNAYTITSTYHGGTGDLTIYSTHPTPSNDPQNSIEYRMTQLRWWKMTDIPETFRQGACALRNARDWAKEKREELIAAANGKVPDAENSDLVSSTQSFASLSSNEPTRPESETTSLPWTLIHMLAPVAERFLHPKFHRIDNPRRRFLE